MKLPLFLALLALAALPASAQNMKPGLWEIKQKPQLEGKQQAQMEEAQKQMANLPPEQRKMMEQMMAQRGVSMSLADGGISIKVCVSPEQAAKNAPPVSDKGNCKHDVTRSGSKTQMRFSCTNPVSEGESEITVMGGDAYTTKTRVTTQRNGKMETMNMSGEGRFLGSDCGTLKPMGQ